MTFILVPKVEAKVLPQSQKAPKAQTTVTKNTTSINVSAKLRSDRKALVINFSNLQNASAVSYLLTYTQNGQSEGAGGAISLTGQTTDSAELLFGTCSKNVCRFHTNIKDAKLEVTYTNNSGKKYIKRFKIKV